MLEAIQPLVLELLRGYFTKSQTCKSKMNNSYQRALTEVDFFYTGN